MTLSVPLPKPSPYDLFSTEQLDGAVAYAGEVIDAALPFVTAVAAPAAIIAGGVEVTNLLLQSHAWDSFWLGVGSKLVDVWHAAGSFLFGHGGAASLDTVSQLIQLSMHITMRGTRQLIGATISKVEAGSHALWHGLVAVQHALSASVTALEARTASVLRYAETRSAQVESYAIARAEGAYASAVHVAATLDAEAHAVLVRDVINPLRSEVAALGALVKPIAGDVTHLGNLIGADIVPKLEAVVGVSALAYTLATAATTFVEECGEEMCQTVGPKTNWGKLFKEFSSVGLLAILAGVEAVDPEAAEQAAADFAKTIGPLLEDWVQGWLGLTHSDVGGDIAEVGKNVGSITL